MKRKNAKRRTSLLGRFLAWLPAPKWLPPLHLPRQLYLQEYTVSMDNIPSALSGLRIAYASDMHYGSYFSRERVIDLAERLNMLEADLIILGGDYGDDMESALAFWESLPPLRAKLAVCAVIGNHDLRGNDPVRLVQAMRRKGATPLINSTLRLRHNGARFCVCATDDLYQGNPDYRHVARQTAAEPFVIYAPHSPDALKAAYEVSEKPFFDLALCGHTHGGQVALFGLSPLTSSRIGWRYGNRYRTGMIRERGATVIVSNGVGSTFLPLRMGVPPQYHLITLKKED